MNQQETVMQVRIYKTQLKGKKSKKDLFKKIEDTSLFCRNKMGNKKPWAGERPNNESQDKPRGA